MFCALDEASCERDVVRRALGFFEKRGLRMRMPAMMLAMMIMTTRASVSVETRPELLLLFMISILAE